MRLDDLLRVAESQWQSCEANKRYFDQRRRRRPESENHVIGLGDMVLLHDTKLDVSHSHKLSNRWVGPYKVVDASRKS